MKTITITLFLLAVAAAQPTITYKLDRAGDARLTVHTQAAESFAPKLEAITGHSQSRVTARGRALLSRIAALVVIVDNTSGEAIDAIAVRYRYEFADGSQHDGYASLIKNAQNPGQFADGATIALFPGAAFGDGFTAINETLISDLPELMARCRSITVSIESIEFAGGRKIGGIRPADWTGQITTPLVFDSRCESAGGQEYDPTACFKGIFAFNSSPQVTIYGRCTNGQYISAGESVTSHCTTFPVYASLFGFPFPGIPVLGIAGNVTVLGSIVGGVYPIFGESTKDCYGVPFSTGTMQAKC